MRTQTPDGPRRGPASGILVVGGPSLHPEVRSLIQRVNHAAVTTLLPSGQPQTQLTWIDANGTHLLVNTRPSTQKFRNIQRDPRITILIWDQRDPEFYAEVRGWVVETVSGRTAIEHADLLAHRYLGGPYRGPTRRIILCIEPVRQLIRRPTWAAQTVHSGDLSETRETSPTGGD